ncbi:pyridoxamine 5'-phosphate oxidase family protein [Nonomuraea jiangxiensis]|uniref:Pyridoxamine 5'-phosphate oxidase family protein n=2 Tax=Nonomuraea jiangxiensis TaxID=633440 RepID=A0A1G9CG76_9ACTN|nr:pyridoxamine 5'-phosphate oxidase family protein [Nonomuraea jiangxiensis]
MRATTSGVARAWWVTFSPIMVNGTPDPSTTATAEEEIAYLRSQPLARVATVSADGQPDVVPLAFEYDGTHFWIGGSGGSVLGTRKFRNLRAGNLKVSLVVDDLVSLDPFIARGVRVYGEAEEPVKRVGLVGPGLYSRITPTVSWSWNLAGEPAGDTWYESRRAVHR